MDKKTIRGLVINGFIILVLVMMACFGGGCESSEDRAARRRSCAVSVATRAAKNMVYVRDKRTNLCFAVSFGGSGIDSRSTIMANVPCEKVKHLLEE